MNLEKEVEALHRDGTVSMELYDTCCRAARRHLKNLDQEMRHDARDVAGDFILWLRSDMRNARVSGPKALRLLMSRFWDRQNCPGGHELWRALSTALRRLEEEGAARRIGRDPSEDNSNDTIWTSFGAQRDDEPIDLRRFYERAGELATFPRSNDRPANAKVLTPTEAKELGLELLEAADGPVTMGQLNGEAQRLVLLPSLVETSEGTADGPGRQNVLTLEKAAEIAAAADQLAEMLWDFCRENELESTLCGYVIPKLLEGEKATLENLGDPRRVGENKEKILRWMSERLIRNPGRQRDEEDVVMENLIVETFARLQDDFCPGRGGKTDEEDLGVKE